MARYKPQDHNSLLLPVVLSEQIIPGTIRELTRRTRGRRLTDIVQELKTALTG